jgi:hypothetical protein
MDNSNLIIKIILLSIILYGIIDNLEYDNKILLIVFIFIYLIYNNQDLFLSKISLTENKDINNIVSKELQIILIELDNYKNYNVDSFNKLLRNTLSFNKIYNDILNGHPLSNQLVQNAELLQRKNLNHISEIILNIPSKEFTHINHSLNKIFNRYNTYTKKCLKKIAKINNDNWNSNTNINTSPCYLDNPKAFNNYNKNTLF